jgi:hypothetical protein
MSFDGQTSFSAPCHHVTPPSPPCHVELSRSFEGAMMTRVFSDAIRACSSPPTISHARHSPSTSRTHCPTSQSRAPRSTGRACSFPVVDSRAWLTPPLDAGSQLSRRRVHGPSSARCTLLASSHEFDLQASRRG